MKAGKKLPTIKKYCKKCETYFVLDPNVPLKLQDCCGKCL